MTDKQPPRVTIYIDGAAVPNPGSGGAGVVLMTEIDGKPYVKAFGQFLGDGITNNAAEISAAIHALKALKFPCVVELISDSQYLVHTMTRGWKRNSNHQLWQELDKWAAKHTVTYTWVRGHAGNEYNETAHTLAENAASLRRDLR